MSENEKKQEVGTYITGVAIFGGIGIWLGGWIGFAIGAGIAIWAISSNADKEAKKKSLPSKTTNSDNAHESSLALDKDPVTSIGFNYSFYSKLVPELLAVCIAADGSVEENEVETATLLIENDEYIKDKQGALESLSVNIEMLSAAIEKSKAVFKLKVSPIIHQAINISDSLEKDRIKILLDSLIEAVQSGDKAQTLEMAEKIKEKLNAQPEITKQDAAEEYIRKSGDQEAISMLNKIKSNPRQYGENLKQAAKGNSVMKTALGVFTGMIASNLVMGAINQYQIEQALANFNAELENIGGIDNLGLGEYDSTLTDASAINFSEASLSENYEEEYASTDDVDEDVDTDEDMDIAMDTDDSGDFFSDLFS
ncbi:hypothetical protein [Aestuariirhabdus litorea]|uniref:hypothetical protein n=1 Tax=Aestuariirhabdus litorea TaxID=2528527 RepID=UPI000F61A881|nr:hypothetical protein [Aestuariirhabdus litorea]RWW97016.1 hypothetical protein DZC74_01335 [Endozoicomonadaceae bacterium GTF-13]